MSKQPLSDNERIKEESNFLRGRIIEVLADDTTESVPGDEQQLLKFHGATLQDDRDQRSSRKKQGLDKAWSFMVRLRIPGGRLTPAQWLKLDELSYLYGNGTLKLTTRQAVQIHGVLKKNLKQFIRALGESSLKTIAGSGDATRNVMTSVNPWQSPVHKEVFDLAAHVSKELEPVTHAPREIWFDEKRPGSSENEEPFYGKTYLPRKFKIGFTVPPDNDTDIFTHDLGFIAITDDSIVRGYNVVVGGGMGYAYGNPDSFPRLGDIIGFCSPDQVTNVARQVVAIHRDFSDRSNRKLARLRYTVARNGVEWFKQTLANYLGYTLAEPEPFVFEHHTDTFSSETGEHTLFIEGGRIGEERTNSIRSFLKKWSEKNKGAILLTANQNLKLIELTPQDQKELQEFLTEHGLTVTNHSALRLASSACTALPFCPMAFTDSERLLPQLVDKWEPVLKEHGLWNEQITTRMTGCPNGCSRPYVAELAFAGKGPGKYNIWLGGSKRGDRLGYLWRESVKAEDIAELISDLFIRFASEKKDNERFGDWSVRQREKLSV